MRGVNFKNYYLLIINYVYLNKKIILYNDLKDKKPA